MFKKLVLPLLAAMLVFAAPAGASVFATDTFTRTVSAGTSWGTTETGSYTWTRHFTSTSDYSVDGAEALFQNPVNSTRGQQIDVAKGDAHIDATLAFQQAPGGSGTMTERTYARAVDDSNRYQAVITLTSTGSLKCNVERVQAGTTTAIGTSSTITTAYTLGTQIFQRFEVQGSTVREKCWLNGTSEPSWLQSVTDTNVTGTGGVGFRTTNSTTSTNAITTYVDGFSVDDFTTPPSDPVVYAAGDIACKAAASRTATTCHQSDTAALVGADATKVLVLGDNQYNCGELDQYQNTNTYDGTWGAFKSITAPVPGNHEYYDQGSVPSQGCDSSEPSGTGAKGYYDYFGAAAGDPTKGYYSFDLGTWHIVALNSEVDIGSGGAQDLWLQNDLASTTQPCILAYWHKPRWSSGSHGNNNTLAPFWSDLYAAHADLVLNGHDHDYERFSAQNTSGVSDPTNGIVEFVVGTGGKEHVAFGTIRANSVTRDNTTFGVLKLTLHSNSYDYAFVPESGGSWGGESATGVSCH